MQSALKVHVPFLLFPIVLDDDGDFLGFDVVIGNPPYGFRGILSTKDKLFFRKQLNIIFPSGDIAELFVLLGSKIQKNGCRLPVHSSRLFKLLTDD